MSMPRRPRFPDPIRLQYFFIRSRSRDHNVHLIEEILSKLIDIQRQDTIHIKELNNILRRVTSIDEKELPKPKNDLARLGLVVPLDIYDERTYAIKERAIYSSGRAKLWKITGKVYELVKGSPDIEAKAKIIATAYLERALMNEWITQLSAYGEKIDSHLAVKVLETIIMSYLRYATSRNEVESLENLLTVCKVKPMKVIRETLKPLEIMTQGDLVKVKRNTIELSNVGKYIILREKIPTTEYLRILSYAYLSYLKESGVYDFIISRSNVGWPAPLPKVIARIEDKRIKGLKLEEHIEYCKKLSYIYDEFEYIYQPFASAENKHVINIKSSLLKKILKNVIQ